MPHSSGTPLTLFTDEFRCPVRARDLALTSRRAEHLLALDLRGVDAVLAVGLRPAVPAQERAG